MIEILYARSPPMKTGAVVPRERLLHSLPSGAVNFFEALSDDVRLVHITTQTRHGFPALPQRRGHLPNQFPVFGAGYPLNPLRKPFQNLRKCGLVALARRP